MQRTTNRTGVHLSRKQSGHILSIRYHPRKRFLLEWHYASCSRSSLSTVDGLSKWRDMCRLEYRSTGPVLYLSWTLHRRSLWTAPKPRSLCEQSLSNTWPLRVVAVQSNVYVSLPQSLHWRTLWTKWRPQTDLTERYVDARLHLDNPCLSSPCLNQALCQADWNQTNTWFTCRCGATYTGARCETSLLNPCGGLCMNG